MTSRDAEPFILREQQGAVVIITLNRREKRNSLHPELVSELEHILSDTAADAGVNVVVLTGAGRSFCAGLDLELLLSWTPEEKLSYLRTVTALFERIWGLPQPVIAAVNGHAIAGGFDLAAFCDIRLAATEAVFGQAEINLGLTQIIHPLYKSIGLARAKELALTGQNINAEEAYRIGLVNHIYPQEELMPKALELAGVLASKPRTALFETKRLTRELIDLDTAAAMTEIGDTFRRCILSDDHRERLAQVYARLKQRP